MTDTSVYAPRASHSHPRPPTSPGGSPRPKGRSGPGSYQITAFALGPSMCEILHAPFNCEVSTSPGPLGLPKLSRRWPSKTHALGACLPSSGPPGWGA